MSQRPINRSPDLKRLRDEGYDIELRAGYLIVRDIPYLNAKRAVKRGSLILKLELADDIAQAPGDHTAYFSGDYPCDQNGNAIERIANNSNRVQLGDGLIADHYFSAKPKIPYPDYHSKVTTYEAILAGPAQTVQRGVTARTFPVVESSEAESVFRYVDTASSRADIGIAAEKLAADRVAIVGLGGTGAYLLDLVSKTHVEEIHLYDGDMFSQHNAFRSPGAASGEDLAKKLPKTTYFATIYSRMRRGIVDHRRGIDSDNVKELTLMSFVFMCIDNGPTKALISQQLRAHDVPFVDTGMGVYLVNSAIGGQVRVTSSTSERPSDVDIGSRIPFGESAVGNDYSTNIQIAELNSLNAALAVIRWKKMRGFYHDFDHEHHCTYTIDGNVITNEDKPKAARLAEPSLR